MPYMTNTGIGRALAVLSLVVAGAALAQTQSTTGQSADKRSSLGKSQSALSSTDRNFMMKAAQTDIAEIQAGQLAKNKGTSDAVKSFGDRMVNDHTKTSEQLKTLAQSRNVTLPAAPAPKDQQAMKKLESVSGAAFDREYMASQVRGHRDAVALFKKEASSGRDAELKSFASATLPALQEHLKMATEMASTKGSGKPAMTHK